MSYPNYSVPDYESSSISVAPRIKFYQYTLFSTCSIYGPICKSRLRCNLCEVERAEGKIRSRKILTLKEISINNFIYDIYLPSLEKYINHISYVHILSSNLCGRLRYDTCYSKAGNICTLRDYVERTSAIFYLEIQSQHFGNGRSLSIEG